MSVAWVMLIVVGVLAVVLLVVFGTVVVGRLDTPKPERASPRLAEVQGVIPQVMLDDLKQWLVNQPFVERAENGQVYLLTAKMSDVHGAIDAFGAEQRARVAA